MITGSVINAAAILVGALAGVFIKWLAGHLSGRLSRNAGVFGKRLQESVMHAVALCVMFIGISGSLKGQKLLVTILSLVLGALVGEALDLDRRMTRLGDWVQSKTGRLAGEGTSISEGFVTASLLFCVGAMAIVGSLENGLTGNCDTLKAKALLDGISAVVFASSLGIGVGFSAVAVLIYQGAISLCAGFVEPFLGGEAVIAEMSCVGSLLILALSLNMLGMTKIRVMNLVPACLMPVILCRFM